MATGGNTKSSNRVGTRYAEEVSLGVVDGSAVWTPVEVNTFADFGATVTTIARAPISASRQEKKGVVVDVEAAGGFNMDLTQKNMYDFLQGFLFANWTEKDNSATTDVTATGFSVADESAFDAGQLIFSEGHTVSSNNGLFLVTGTVAGEVQAAGTSVDASAGTIKVVGEQAASGDLNVDATTDPTKPRLTSTTLDFTTLDVEVGEWMFVGGDSASLRFANAVNNGFGRVYSVAANELVFDRTSSTMVDETGTGLTVQLFIGDFLHNEDDSDDIVSHCYQFERILDSANNQYEYLLGCVPNVLTITMNTAEKVTLDLAFVATDVDLDESSLKAGTRPDLVEGAAFNTSSDFSRLTIEGQNITGSGIFFEDYSIEVNNNVTPVKALSVLGNHDLIEGNFVVSGNFTAYFTTTELVQAVRNNDDIQMDFAFVKDNAGLLFDIPLASLGEGRINVEKDNPIKVPLAQNAARDPYLTYTLGVMNFDYLPSLADV